MIIYLIRHGITQANLNHVYCGSTDLPLAEEGKQALNQSARAYSAPEHCIFYTSGMKRTNQTLRLLFGEVSFTEEPDLREPDFGIFELRSYEELKDLPEYRKWITGDYMKNVPPKGESGEQMAGRVHKAMNKILSAGRNCVIVTHGGVIAELMCSMFPEENKNQYEWQPKPGFGYCIDTGSHQYKALP